ncbi:MAG: DUF2092 domain-containing protein [Planctomycetota bacterium]|jgi:hypothetical protein
MKRSILIACAITWIAAAQEPAKPESVKIDAKVDTVLKGMAATLKGAGHYRFGTVISFDLPGDPKLQFNATQAVSVRAPDGFRVDYDGDLAKRLILFDQGKLAYYDLAEQLYASMEAGPTVDDALDKLFDKAGFNVPIADFIYSDVYESLTEGLVDAAYIGRGMVGSWSCDRVVIRQPHVDLQLWVEAGEKKLPRKIVLTYKKLEGQPQFEAVFTRWEFGKAADLAHDVPKDFGRIEFVSTMGKGK